MVEELWKHSSFLFKVVAYERSGHFNIGLNSRKEYCSIFAPQNEVDYFDEIHALDKTAI
jgi:hypothetical protein